MRLVGWLVMFYGTSNIMGYLINDEWTTYKTYIGNIYTLP